MTRKSLMKLVTVAASILLLAEGLSAMDSNAPALYLDQSRPVDHRIANLISRLTLEEKATLLNHRGPTVARFNIRSDQWNQWALRR